MKAASSGKNITTFISRLWIASIAGALTITLLGFAAPALRAETPLDQIKAAGAIPLAAGLLDKVERFIKNVRADVAAKAELVAADKDPSMTAETWGSVVSSKCPKAVEIFKASGVTPDEFAKAMFAIMAVGMSEDLTLSYDKTVRANAAFVAANKDRCQAVFAAFLTLGEALPSAPASNP
jgi:hypothetical protein